MKRSQLRSQLVLGTTVVVIGLLASACGGGSSESSRKPPKATTTTTAAVATTTTVAPPTTASSSPSSPAPAAGTSATSQLVAHLVGVGSAQQLVVVTADGYGQTTATLNAYELVNGNWQSTFGPWTAHLGFNGFAAPNAKREGDGKTPSGSYGFDFFFGVLANPGVNFPYRPITSSSIVWDDDSNSPLYNQWVDASTQNPGAGPEPMYNQPAYNYGAVIAYNTAHTPQLGSAIFFHVFTGGATAGCVSLPSDQLLQVLRWLNPSRSPRIIMGTTAAVTS